MESTTFVTPEIRRKFLQRIEDDLRRQPLEMEPQQHRRELQKLLAELPEADFYDLLKVSFGAPEEELLRCYRDLARLTHPSHAERLGLKEKEVALEVLFERATEAYLTLSDPERNRSYQLAMGPELLASHVRPNQAKRRQEEREVAAINYRLARSAAAREDYHTAVQLLVQTVNVDPQVEYFRLLGDCLARNPHWLQWAAESLSKAIGLRPDDPELRVELGVLYEKAGNPARAREEFEAALERMPGFPTAIAGIERVASSRKSSRSSDEGGDDDGLGRRIWRWLTKPR